MKKMCNTDDVIKCRKCATQMKSSYGCEARNDQLNRRIVSLGLTYQVSFNSLQKINFSKKFQFKCIRKQI